MSASNAFLGSSKDLSEKDIDENIISRSRIVYLEGYLFDPLEAQKAFRTASNFAHKHGSLVAFTLSDSFCVERHREKMIDFISKEVNILLCNEAEVFSLYKNNSLKYCINNLRNEVDIAAITMGKKGAIIIDKTNTHEIIALPAKVIDTTGAGDFFAAGFLAGLSKNFDLEQAGKLGAACSAEIITHFGARPEIPLYRYVKKFKAYSFPPLNSPGLGLPKICLIICVMMPEIKTERNKNKLYYIMKRR